MRFIAHIIFCLAIVQFINAVPASAQDLVEFEREFASAVEHAKSVPIPPKNMLIESVSESSTSNELTELCWIVTGDESAGMLIYFVNDFERRQVFNPSYGFVIERTSLESKWKLVELDNDGSRREKIKQDSVLCVGNKLGYTFLLDIINDDSFKIESLNPSVEQDGLLELKFSCDLVERETINIVGGALAINVEKLFRIESYTAHVRFGDDPPARFEGINKYFDDGILRQSIIQGYDDSGVSKTEVSCSYDIPPEVFEDFGELYYLSDYGFPEPPLGGSTLFSPWKIGMALALLMFGIFCFWCYDLGHPFSYR